MNEHPTDLLLAYYDGELHGEQFEWVEAHLSECLTCQEELKTYERLSALLHEVPVPAPLIPDERFAAQVAARAAGRKNSFWKRLMRLGWFILPLGLISGWAAFQVLLILAGLLANGWIPVDMGMEGLALPGWGPLPGLGIPLLVDWLAHALAWPEPLQVSLQLGFLDLTATVLMISMLAGWLALWWASERQSQLTFALAS